MEAIDEEIDCPYCRDYFIVAVGFWIHIARRWLRAGYSRSKNR